MVNTGKPSPGCHACRARRMKCDETKPQCRKCRNRGIECPGYRDLTALRIVDQTQKYSFRAASSSDARGNASSGSSAGSAAGSSSKSTAVVAVSKQSRGSKAARAAAAEASSASSSSDDKAALVPAQHAGPRIRVQQQFAAAAAAAAPGAQAGVRPCPGIPLGAQVFNFFFSHFVLNSQAGEEQGYLDFLRPLLPNQPQGAPLPLAFSAAALAAFGTHRKIKEMLHKAEAMYLRALEATGRAIGDPGRARDNSTLASVALLSVFEQIRPSRLSLKAPEAWGSHLDGAWALIKARGTAQFRSPVGRRIFVITRSMLTSRAMAYSTPFDPQLHGLTEELEQEVHQKRYGQLSLKNADLRVALEHTIGTSATKVPTPADITALLRRAEALEAEYASWANSLPASWRPTKGRWPGSAASSPSSTGSGGSGGSSGGSGPRVDTYSGLFVCYIVNMARAGRIYCRSMALRCVDLLAGPAGDYRATAEHILARSLCTTLIADVVASVPYAFGKVVRGDDGEPVPVDERDAAAGVAAPRLPRCTAGMFMLWPVFTAASSDFATDEQRAFLRSALAYIAGELGIGMATILAKYDFRQPSMPIMLARMRRQAAMTSLLHSDPS